MSEQKNRTSWNLGQYMRDVFDLNKDGRVSPKEFITAFLPGFAPTIAFIVVDILALIGEYRVWNFGMTVTAGDPYGAAGFVAVSLLPFYLGQILWLYPRANWFQQLIAVGMVAASLVTSVQFGFADLSKQYDSVAISHQVTNLWLGYIVALLVYIVSDKAFRLQRMKVNAKANAAFQDDMNRVGREIMMSLRASLEAEKALRAEFGDDAVDAHLQMLRGRDGKTRREDQAALPAPADNSNSGGQSKPYPIWELEPFLKELGLTHDKALAVLGQNPDEFYRNLKPHGIEKMDISRKNFGKLYGQLRANGRGVKNPT